MEAVEGGGEEKAPCYWRKLQSPCLSLAGSPPASHSLEKHCRGCYASSASGHPGRACHGASPLATRQSGLLLPLAFRDLMNHRGVFSALCNSPWPPTNTEFKETPLPPGSLLKSILFRDNSAAVHPTLCVFLSPPCEQTSIEAARAVQTNVPAGLGWHLRQCPCLMSPRKENHPPQAPIMHPNTLLREAGSLRSVHSSGTEALCGIGQIPAPVCASIFPSVKGG